MNPKIGIAITTKNREESFSKCILSHNTYIPSNAIVVIVDDGSDPCYSDYTVRHIYSKGISSSKNKCLELLMNAGCDHLFLFDDDAYPLKKDWHLPYINSGEHHLCATFYKPWKIENGLNIHRLGNGYCLYFTRHCIEIVGGFNIRYINKFEHCDLSRRIYNARLTNNVYQDVIGSEKLIYCLDQDNAIQRSFTEREMQDNIKAGYEYFRSQENSSRYIEFRT